MYCTRVCTRVSRDRLFRLIKKTFYRHMMQHVLKLNLQCVHSSLQAQTKRLLKGYKMQNRTSAYRHAYRSPNTKFLIKLWTFENRQFCMRTVWRQVVQENPMQIVYRHLPRLPIWLRIPTEKEKCSHFREKGGVLTQINLWQIMAYSSVHSCIVVVLYKSTNSDYF